MKRNFNFQSNTVVIPKKIVDIGQTNAPDQPPSDLIDFPYPADFKKGYYFIPHKLKASNSSKLKKANLDSIPDDFGFIPDDDNPFTKPISAILSGINSSTIRTPKVLGYTTKIKNEKKMKKKYIGEENSIQSVYPTFLVSPANTKQTSQVDRIKQEIEESRKKLGIEYSTLKADPRVTKSIKINPKVPEPRRSLMGQSKSQKSLHLNRNYESWNASPELRHKLGNFTISAGTQSSYSSIVLPSINMQHSRKTTKLNIGSESEERGIKAANLKIRNAVKSGMKPYIFSQEICSKSFNRSVSCENLKKILLNQANYFHSPQAQPVAMESERAPILVLLDKELMFIKDYMDDLRYSLRLVFDKVDSYEYLAQKDKPTDLTKRNQLPTYACVFIFLKTDPSPLKASINVFNEMLKKHACYLVKCSMGEKNEEADGEFEKINLTQRSASTMQHCLTLGYNKFKTQFVPYEEYQALQNFIITKSKAFDDYKRNSVARSSS